MRRDDATTSAHPGEVPHTDPGPKAPTATPAAPTPAPTSPTTPAPTTTTAPGSTTTATPVPVLLERGRAWLHNQDRRVGDGDKKLAAVACGQRSAAGANGSAGQASAQATRNTAATTPTTTSASYHGCVRIGVAVPVQGSGDRGGGT
jgi:hypothetical protein